jgi:TolB-like protein/Tfp pilus assembly protein PilF
MPFSHFGTDVPMGQTLRFGDFELNESSYELRRRGRPVPLERQPMDLLLLLLARRGRLVSRQEIVDRLWPKDVFVDVEAGVNTAIRKIRRALNDSSDAPTFIETVSGRGYRFVAEVEVVGGHVAAPIATLAVLPFANLSGDPEREYVADGLTDDTIATLGQLDPARLRVIGRTSAMAYKGSRKSLAAIGAELGAKLVLEGSIRIEGPVLRIRCALSRTHDQVQLWSNTYDRPLTSLLDVQRELSVAMADQVSVHLSPERLDAVVRRHSQDAAAYDLYLRGRRFWNQLTPASTRMAIDCFRRATDIDRAYALAWAGLAEAFAAAPINGDADPAQMWPLARAAAEQAVRSNPDLSEAQRVAGQVQWFFAWNFRAANAAFRKAVELDPNNASAQTMYGHALSQLGRHDEGQLAMERACTLEPLSAFHFAMASQVVFQARDFGVAADRARRTIVIDPEFWVGYMMRGQAAEQAGDLDLALDQLAIAARFSGGNSKPVSLRGYVLARAGRLDEAREVQAMLDDVARTRYVPPYAQALVALGLQEDDRALAALERACEARDVHLVFLPVDPKWDRLREHPSFRAVLERCGFTQG